MDIDEGFHVPIIFEWPFLATARDVIDETVGKIYFQLCGENADFVMRL